ncbi:unnamed protein product [Staurois parvus]|uniref:Uncharacterized protein n=1 Tax=Staurois parvus TaxID=386267 RepID=A0ABN9H751_9NEOB|nr:unnamed protein product [Staurois parvus]
MFVLRNITHRQTVGGHFRTCCQQARTDNSWGPQAIGDHGAPVSFPTLKAHPKKPIKKVPGAFHGAPY